MRMHACVSVCMSALCVHVCIAHACACGTRVRACVLAYMRVLLKLAFCALPLLMLAWLVFALSKRAPGLNNDRIERVIPCLSL